MKYVLILLFSTTLLSQSYAQNWCKKRKPAHFEEPAGTFEDKLVSDRFNHTITPLIVKFKYTQVEFSTVLRNEIVENGEWANDPNDYTFNYYNNLLIKHSFNEKLEFHICYTDFLLKGDSSIRDLSRTSRNTAISFGTKYCIYQSPHNKIRLSLFGQLTIPKPRYTLNTFLTPEIRFLFLQPVGKHMNITYNLGGAFSPVTEHLFLLYGINPKIEITKRIEVFGEFFKSFTKTGAPRVPIKRGLFGFGFYILENLYFYSSFEAGWYHEESLNSERFDLGLAFRFL